MRGTRRTHRRFVLSVATLLAGSIALAQSDPVVVHDFNNGLDGVRAASTDVHLSVARDPSLSSQQVLIVEYPLPTKDPAGRDVQCLAENQNWTTGAAIAFPIKPDQSMRLSFSFLDRNGVVYTTRTELKGGEWQTVRIRFDDVRPNQFFQPPGAKTGAPIDVSEVKFVAFAPQDQTAGRFAIGRIVVTK